MMMHNLFYKIYKNKYQDSSKLSIKTLTKVACNYLDD